MEAYNIVERRVKLSHRTIKILIVFADNIGLINN